MICNGKLCGWVQQFFVGSPKHIKEVLHLYPKDCFQPLRVETATPERRERSNAYRLVSAVFAQQPYWRFLWHRYRQAAFFFVIRIIYLIDVVCWICSQINHPRWQTFFRRQEFQHLCRFAFFYFPYNAFSPRGMSFFVLIEFMFCVCVYVLF